jgi:hypothetical protein
MLKERTRAAQMVAAKLMPVEADVNQAMTSLAALTSTMLAARTEANLSAVVGREAFDHIGEATNLLFKVRSSVLAAHTSLAETRDSIGLRVVSVGAWQDCPPMHAHDDGSNVVAINQ